MEGFETSRQSRLMTKTFVLILVFSGAPHNKKADFQVPESRFVHLDLF